ncbi:MAG: nickel-responsive transcriptional regulator NikR [Elusimicrobiales bacterium]
MKGKLARFGVSLEGELLRRFDAYIGAEGSENRSQAIAGLIRKEFVADAFDHGPIIISAQHVRLDHDNCLEIVAVKGPAAGVRALADALKSVKGGKHSTLSVAI